MDVTRELTRVEVVGRREEVVGARDEVVGASVTLGVDGTKLLRLEVALKIEEMQSIKKIISNFLKIF